MGMGMGRELHLSAFSRGATKEKKNESDVYLADNKSDR
jgi:hypothetical protein